MFACGLIVSSPKAGTEFYHLLPNQRLPPAALYASERRWKHPLVMAGLDPAIHEALRRVEALHGLPGLASANRA